MKVLLFALAITICFANPTLRDLQLGDSEAAVSSGVIKALHGKITNGRLADSDYEIVTISNLTQVNTTDGILYNAIVDLTNNQDTQLIANVSVLYNAEEKRVEISAFNYQLIHSNETANETTVSNTTGIANSTDAAATTPPTSSSNATAPINNTSPDGYTQLDPSFVSNNKVAYGAVVFGVNSVVQNGISQVKIPNTKYTVTQITGVSIKNISLGADYKVSANLVNADLVRMEVRCTVFYNKQNGSYKLLSYYYKASNISDVAIDNSTNTTAPNNSTNNSTANVTTNNTTSDGYTILDVTQVQQSSAIQAALQFGISELILTGASQNKFPNTTYNVSKLVSASYKNIAKSVSYKFYVALINAKYAHVDANLTVNYNLANGSYKLSAYNFRSYNFSNNDLPIKANTSVNTGSNSSNTTVVNNNTTTVSNSTTNSTGNSTSNNSTNSGSSTNSTSNNSTNSSTNTTVNTTVSDGYTQIDLAQVAQNNRTQGAFSFGVAAILQEGVNQNKIPNSPFNVSSVGSASYKTQNNGAYYKFSASLISARYAHVDTNFTVFYRNSNQSYTLLGYAWKSSNHSNSINNTNTTLSVNTTIPVNRTNNTSPVNGSTSTNSTVVNSTSVTVVNATSSTVSNSTNSTASNSTLADSYTSLNVSQVLQNATLTGFINQGTASILKIGVNQTKIPDTPFNLTQVVSFAERDTPRGNYYNVSAVLKNANNVTVSMNFTELYRFPAQANANGTLSVQSWTYSVATPVVKKN